MHNTDVKSTSRRIRVSNRLLTREQKDAVNAVFKSTSARILKHLPDWNFALGKQQLKAIHPLLKSIAGKIGNISFAVEITQRSDAGRSSLTTQDILSANAGQILMPKLGENLCVVGVRKLGRSSQNILSPVNMSNASAKTVILLREGNEISVYAGGFTVAFFDLSSPDVEPPSSARFARRAEDYEQSILDHYRESVRYCQHTDHWKDRKKRILFHLKGTHKTEHIFHHDLHHWLNTFLEAQVVSSATFTSKDELDILIIAPDGRTYLIEVKWMGTNGKTTYRIKDISKGLKQLDTYLKRQPKIFKGTLVAYDGRREVEFQSLTCSGEDSIEGCKKLASCNGVHTPERGSCLILFLDSRTASDQ
jgi:hypothetical protein